jgi:hypothetical protein
MALVALIRPPRARALRLAIATVVLLAPAGAAARPVTATASLGYALVSAGGVRHGAMLGAEAHVGLSDSWMIGGAGHYSVTSGGGHLGGAAASLLWKLDVVHWVPFATLEVGGLFHSLAGRDAGADLALAFGIGLDRLLSRDVAVGFHARYHLVATDVSAIPGVLSAGVRVRWSWE